MGDLLRSATQRNLLLRGLVKLWAVGLLMIDTPPVVAGQNDIMTPKALQRFLERVAENLEDQPLHLAAEAHRAAVAGALRPALEGQFLRAAGDRARRRRRSRSSPASTSWPGWCTPSTPRSSASPAKEDTLRLLSKG